MALLLLVVVGTALAVAIGLASSTRHDPGHAVTIPPADRSASAELLREAEAVNFHPATEAGAGTVESGALPDPLPAASGSLLPVGSAAPAFALHTQVGKPFTLASLRGKTVLLELFATWCPHCAAEAPHLKALYDKLPHDRYAFVSVNADSEDAGSVLAYHIWFGLPFPSLLDPGSAPGSFSSPGSPGPVSSAYRAHVLPTFYVIGRDGKIAWSATGEQPDALLLRELRLAAGAR